MEITVERLSSDIAVVRPIGRIDLQTAPEAKRELIALIDEGYWQIVVDLGETTFIDSSGLGALIGGLKAARQKGGDLRLARPSQQAQVVLELTTLNRVLHAHDTVEDALVSYQQTPH